MTEKNVEIGDEKETSFSENFKFPLDRAKEARKIAPEKMPPIPAAKVMELLNNLSERVEKFRSDTECEEAKDLLGQVDYEIDRAYKQVSEGVTKQGGINCYHWQEGCVHPEVNNVRVMTDWCNKWESENRGEP